MRQPRTDLDPDWLRAGTDIIGAGTFNQAFTLTRTVAAVHEPRPIDSEAVSVVRCRPPSDVRRPETNTCLRLVAAVQISALNVCGERNLTLAAFPVVCPLSSEPDLHWRSVRRAMTSRRRCRSSYRSRWRRTGPIDPFQTWPAPNLAPRSSRSSRSVRRGAKSPRCRRHIGTCATLCLRPRAAAPARRAARVLRQAKRQTRARASLRR